MLRVIGGAFVILLIATTSSRGGFTITISQVNDTVEADGSGSIKLSTLFFVDTIPASAGVTPSSSQLLVGSLGTYSINRYTANFITQPTTSFGSGGLSTPSSGSGLLMGVDGLNYIAVDATYRSAEITTSSIWDNTTISALGLTPGIYEWSWASETGADELTVNILGASAAPEPSSLLLAGTAIGVVGLFTGIRRRAHRLGRRCPG